MSSLSPQDRHAWSHDVSVPVEAHVETVRDLLSSLSLPQIAGMATDAENEDRFYFDQHGELVLVVPKEVAMTDLGELVPEFREQIPYYRALGVKYIDFGTHARPASKRNP